MHYARQNQQYDLTWKANTASYCSRARDTSWISPRRARRTRRMEFDELSKQVIGCAIEVHHELGPGLLEPTYETYEQCLAHELNLNKNGIKRFVL